MPVERELSLRAALTGALLGILLTPSNVYAGLKASPVTDVHVFGRRGPAQVKFTNAEIKEFGELGDAEPVVDPAELELDPLSAQELH